MNKNFIDNIDSKDAILKTEDLSVFYGNTKAVDKVTFSIKIDGECYRVITKKVLNRLNSVNMIVNKINKSHTIRKKIERNSHKEKKWTNMDFRT